MEIDGAPLEADVFRILRQAQQLAWHQYDFIAITCVSLTALVWAITVLARAALGTLQGGPILVSICTAYIALAGWTVLRCCSTRVKLFATALQVFLRVELLVRYLPSIFQPDFAEANISRGSDLWSYLS